ncbi:type IV secretory system conjugative DNA transfer family protein [Oscillochloris sp. ZM17-4]|uniref:type IV secretory system conjugative DNA transfer family protein n=1 Tax=Oscillochloris sp. ZM17-4 TaxID=2866714 RepID=UPI001C739851|nr:type IV secretory system conjugative DNA transfer family protein [Oscillochloris sp. ZM17-4]MBX0326955.1 type IV secretory system conjugative DNA transfer family protein [Oscillochloris sp. ZM17-4]
MALITGEELARGLLIGLFGGAAGVCTVALPGSPIWIVPAGIAVGGCALTVPEVRQEITPYLAQLPAPAQLRQLPAQLRQLPAQLRRALPAPAAPADVCAQTSATGRTPKAQAAQQEAEPAAGELQRQLEDTPHRLIIGHTRGGKTTLIHAMATDWAARGERVLVGDPDAAPGLWPGCEVRGAGDNIASIGELLTIVDAEVAERRAQRAQGVRRFPVLHLVIDEAQDVLPALDGGLELFEDVARRGGKLNIRMTVGVQDKMVGTLGLKGKSEVLRNLQIADVLKGRDGRRVAVLRDAESGKKISLPIPELTDPESLITTPAAVAVPRPAEGVTTQIAPDDLLAYLLAEPAPSASQSVGAPATETATATYTAGAGAGAAGVVMSLGAGAGAGAPGITLNVNARAEAIPPGRVRPRRGRGLNMHRRRQLAQEQQQDERKAELRAAYEARKAVGISHRKAFAELGGSSEETRAWWRAAPGPKGVTP